MKVLNFGSLNLDHVYSVRSFVNAGETVSSEKMETFCGGKGLNQSVAFAHAGAEVYHAGCVGGDGRMLTDLLAANGVNVDFVETRDVPTGHAVIQVDARGENCILLFGGANRTVTAEQIDRTLLPFEKGDLLMLQNEVNDIASIAKAAHEKGMTVALNPSPFNDGVRAVDMQNVDWLILNETEGRDISGRYMPEDIIEQLLLRYPDMKIVLTLGKDGAVYADRLTRASHGIFPVTAVDTTAAGDTFTGFFFASVMGEKSPYEALRIASAASAIAVSRPGAAPSIPTMAEVEAFLSHADR